MKTKNIRNVLLVGLILGVSAIGIGYAGYRAYLSVRQDRLIKQAQYYITKPDTRKALLCLQRVLRSNPKNADACRLMAQLSDAIRSPAALIWRGRVVELCPHSLDDRLALAQSAMIFGDHALATNALEAVDIADKKSAAYHNVAGEVAATLGQFSSAEAHFLEAARIEPTNQVPLFNLAVARFHGTNAAAMDEARAALKHIVSSQSAMRCQALRELVADARRFRQTNTVLTLSRDLVQQTNSTFSDRLLLLDALKATKSPEFGSTLASFQRDAGTNTSKIFSLSVWEMNVIGPAATLLWLRSLPRNTQTNHPVPLLTADCQTKLGDWRELQDFLKKQDWAELDCVRHAFLTRALREQNFAGAATAEWQQALKAANGDKGSLIILLRMAAQWNWQSEGEDLLWIIVNQHPDEKWAAQALSQALYAGGRTRPLLQLFMQAAKRAPSELLVKNNLAMIALLLDAKELRPHELAREVYQAGGTNASFASTYAFSLYLQGKIPEAMKVYQSLDSKYLDQPSYAGYYGLILNAAGERERAKPYLDLALKGPMLPEERKLFERAKTGS
jgi:tetratricopeptide (TPR) repeat protein